MRVEAGTYNAPAGGLLILDGPYVSWHPGERLDPLAIIRWSNDWPHGDTVRMHLRVRGPWWVRVA